MPAPGAPQLPPISFIRLRRFMPQWETEGDFSKGMVRDAPRASIPQGGVYNAVDWMLDSPGIAYKRGGTTYAGPALGATAKTGAVFYADFPSGGQLLAIGDDYHLYKVTAGASTDIGNVGTFRGVGKPVLHHGGTKYYAIFPMGTVYKYNGTTLGTLTATGAPSAATACAVYKSRLVLAGASPPQRVFFSPSTLTSGTDIDQAWDTASWLDADYPVYGLAALPNMLLVFSRQQVERITGSIPPNSLTTDSDMGVSVVAGEGITDGASITVWQNYAIFCNTRSIFMTNGVGVQDLLARSGMVKFWQNLMQGWTPSLNAGSWFITTGVIWNKYLWVSSYYTAHPANTATLVCNLLTNSWWQVSNVHATMYAAAPGVGGDELYYSSYTEPRVTQTSSCFFPAAANKNDANGTPVQPVLETKVIAPSAPVKTYGRGWVEIDLRDAASDNPTMKVEISPGVEADQPFVAVAESPLAENLDEVRKPVTWAKTDQGITVRLTQQGPSAKTEIYAIELETIGIGQEYGTPQ